MKTHLLSQIPRIATPLGTHQVDSNLDLQAELQDLASPRLAAQLWPLFGAGQPGSALAVEGPVATVAIHLPSGVESPVATTVAHHHHHSPALSLSLVPCLPCPQNPTIYSAAFSFHVCQVVVDVLLVILISSALRTLVISMILVIWTWTSSDLAVVAIWILISSLLPSPVCPSASLLQPAISGRPRTLLL